MKIVKEVEEVSKETHEETERQRKLKLERLIKSAGDKLMENENKTLDTAHVGALPDRYKEAEKWGKVYNWLMQIHSNRFPNIPEAAPVPESPKIIQP